MDLVILTDYRGQFYSSQRSSTIGMNLDKICRNFSDYGVHVTVTGFSDVALNMDCGGKWFLYQSSEDRDLLYKSYISDILFGH